MHRKWNLFLSAIYLVAWDTLSWLGAQEKANEMYDKSFVHYVAAHGYTEIELQQVWD